MHIRDLFRSLSNIYYGAFLQIVEGFGIGSIDISSSQMLLMKNITSDLICYDSGLIIKQNITIFLKITNFSIVTRNVLTVES